MTLCAPQWRKKMFWSRGAEISFGYGVAVAGFARHNIGGSGGVLTQEENLDFYISLDRFWCILSTLVHKYYDFLEISLYIPLFVGESLTMTDSKLELTYTHVLHLLPSVHLLVYFNTCIL